jgi:glutathione S-transferase
MSSLHDAQNVQYTLYTQPYLLYPRRIHSYLTAKPLPSNIKIKFEYLTFDKSGQMNNPPGKPSGSIPMMRIGPQVDNNLIRQSVAILSYLEETHPRLGSSYAAQDMRGSTPSKRARVNEILCLTEDATAAFGFWVCNASALFESIGMPQNREVGEASEKRMHRVLATVEEYCRRAVMEEDKWVAGTEGMTLADVVLGSLVEYARDMYGRNIIGGSGETGVESSHEVLGKWLDKWESTEAGRPGEEKVPPREWSELAGTWKW